MKAFVADPESALGVAERHVDDPVAMPGRVLVEVTATSLNRGEALHAATYRSLPPGHPLGWDFAGVIVAEATDGTGPKLGTPVFGWTPRRGTWAERVLVDVGNLAVLPDGLSMDDAATLGVAALTAAAALQVRPSPFVANSVLVTGANGGLGAFAVQLAALAGAQVTACVRATGEGAEEVAAFLPANARIEHGLDPDGPPADLIIECVGSWMLSAALRRIGHGGTVVTVGRTVDEAAEVPSGWFHKGAVLTGLTVGDYYGSAPGRTSSQLQRLAGLVTQGRLTTNITRTVGRTDLTSAISDLLERKVHGKVVVRFDAHHGG